MRSYTEGRLSRYRVVAMSKDVKKWNNREISELNRYNFLTSYSFMKLIAYINAKWCSVYFHILISSLHVLCDLSSINNDKTIGFWLCSHPCFWGH